MADITTLYIKVDSKGVVTASKNLGTLTKASKGTEDQLGKTTGATGKLNDKTKQTATTMTSLSSGFKTTGRDLQRYSLILAAAAAAVTKFSFDLSSGLGQVQTLIPGTGDRIYELEQAVQDLAVSSGKNFQDLNSGLYQTISAFQDSADTIEIFTQATEAAIAGGARVADSIALSSAVTKAYGEVNAEATQRVFDLAFETVRLGQTTFPELANGIQKATDSAVRLGVSQEELFATFSALTGVIGDASEVATKFRSASASLLNPNKALLGLFEQLANATGETVDSGEDFVRVSGGWQQALDLIVTTAEESGKPLQTYIRRIEGITLASRIAGNSAEKYASDLIDANKATGAANRSYKEVKEGIDAFRQSILESKQQIAVAASEIGENLIPRLADLFQRVADGVTWVSNLDSGFQHFIITVGATIPVVSTLLILIGSVSRAIIGIQAVVSTGIFTTLLAGIGGPAGLIVLLGIAAVAFGIVNAKITKSAEEQKKLRDVIASSQGVLATFTSLSKEYEDVGEFAEVNVKLNKDLIDQYPELAGSVDVYNDSLSEVYATLVQIKQLEFQDAIKGLNKDFMSVGDQLKILRGQTSGIGDGIVNEFNRITQGLERPFESIEDLIEESRSGSELGDTLADTYAVGIAKYELMLGQIAQSEGKLAEIIGEARALTDDTGILNLVQTSEGFYTFPKTLEEIFQRAKDVVDKNKGDLTPTPDVSDDPDALKTWQEWFESITGVAKETFGESGTLAGQLFNESLAQEFQNEKTFAKLMGEDFAPLKVIEDQRDRVQQAIKDLVSIPASEIKDQEIFKLAGVDDIEKTDNVMQQLVSTLTRLNGAYVVFTEFDLVDTLNADIDALETLNGVMGEDIASFDALTDKAGILQKALESALSLENVDPSIIESILGKINITVEEMSNTFEGAEANVANFTKYLKDNLFEALKELPELSADAAFAIAEVGTQLAEVAGNQALDAIKSFGKALTDAEDVSVSFKNAIVAQAQAILDMLPSLFMQAGLQLIATGDKTNRAIGFGFLAAGTVSALIAGVTSGATEKAEANATGNAFSSNGIVPFAKGGSFTNSIVDKPTTFAFANGGALGLMGEAGAEAILPLTRTSSGNLGVEATGTGGGTNVSIKIINNTGSNVETSETKTPSGREIEIIIGQTVSKGLSSGQFDKPMNTRYGSKVSGVNN